MPSADASVEPLSIEELDYEIPCSYTNCVNPGDACGGKNAAVWAVWYTDKNPCGCDSPKFRYFCDPCWVFRSGCRRWTCPTCGLVWDAWRDNVVRVEKIK